MAVSTACCEGGGRGGGGVRRPPCPPLLWLIWNLLGRPPQALPSVLGACAPSWTQLLCMGRLARWCIFLRRLPRVLSQSPHQPCMLRAAATCTGCTGLRIPGRMTYCACPIGAPTRKWDCRIPRFQELQQSSRLRSCTLCIQGSVQKQDVAEPLCRPPSLTLSVHGARGGPAPRAQVSSLWALPCPLPGVSNPLRGAGAPPCSSSLGDVTVAALVKPRAKKPRAVAGR